MVLKDSSENGNIQQCFDVVSSRTAVYNIGKFVTSKDEERLGIRTTQHGSEFLNSIKSQRIPWLAKRLFPSQNFALKVEFNE
jgi:hypothetical protein